MEYEVLSPWGEVDAAPPRALQPRVTDLNGTTVGLFSFFKEHAPFIMEEVERQLKKRFPKAKFSYYQYPKHVAEIIDDPDYRPTLEKWLKGVDTVLTGNGD